MDNANFDFILNIFTTLTGEIPEQMLYREDGNSIELRTLGSADNCLSVELQKGGWDLIGGIMEGAA